MVCGERQPTSFQQALQIDMVAFGPNQQAMRVTGARCVWGAEPHLCVLGMGGCVCPSLLEKPVERVVGCQGGPRLCSEEGGIKPDSDPHTL